MEMEHIDKYRALMNNRMYCDYYKLYNIIITHIKENRADIDVTELELKSYPAYKDLEPFQEYKIEDIKEIHANILFLINQIYSKTLEKMTQLNIIMKIIVLGSRFLIFKHIRI